MARSEFVLFALTIRIANPRAWHVIAITKMEDMLST